MPLPSTLVPPAASSLFSVYSGSVAEFKFQSFWGAVVSFLFWGRGVIALHLVHQHLVAGGTIFLGEVVLHPTSSYSLQRPDGTHVFVAYFSSHR